MVNTTAAIMALPAPLDPIHLVGDEDKHATLLFFGETSTLPADAQSVLADSVKQACEMLVCFSESIRDVSRLGSDNPPALVAMLSDRNLTQVRNLFAMNPAVKGYLDNTPQFPSFTPHVTLGHPDFTEEVILRTLAKQLYRVQFDRLAVWWNDERFEFPLTQLVEGDDMAMSDAVDKFLEHHGVKGQKWGVRKDAVGIGAISGGTLNAIPGTVVAVRKKGGNLDGANGKPLDKAEGAYLAQHVGIAQHAALTEGFKAGGPIDLLNARVYADYEKTGNWNDKAQSTYDGYVAKHMEDAANVALKSSGLAAHVDVSDGSNFMMVVGHPKAVKNFKKDTKHLGHIAQTAVATVVLVPIRKAPGIIVGFEDNKVSHIDAAVDNILEHHGVKGQKWGVRKEGTDANNHSVFVATGAKPKIGQEFTHGGQTHVVNRAVTRADGKHVITTQQQAKAQLGSKLVENLKKDKEYWHKQAAIFGVVGAGLAAAALAPAVVPAAALAAGGGAAVVSGKITLGVGIAARAGYVHNYFQWRGRVKAQAAVAHSDMNDTRTIGEVYDQLSPDKKLAADLMVAAFAKGEEVADNSVIQNGWADMTQTERSVTLFLATAVDAPGSVAHSDIDPVDTILEHHGIKGMKWGVRRPVGSSGLVSRVIGRKADSTPVESGLKPRTGSADQIHQDRIQKKIDTVGIHSLSSAEIQSYTRRLQLEKDVKSALAAQSAATQAKADGFIKKFVKSQVSRQTNRVVDKAIDVAMEQAVLATGLKLNSKHKSFDPTEELPKQLTLGKGLIETSKRMAPKKK